MPGILAQKRHLSDPARTFRRIACRKCQPPWTFRVTVSRMPHTANRARRYLVISVSAAAVLVGALVAPATASTGDPQQRDPEQTGIAGLRSVAPGAIPTGVTPQLSTRAISRESTESRIASLLQARIPRLRQKLGPNLTVHVTDAASGRTIFGRRDKHLMLPASNMKVITAAAALSVLGPNTKYTTRVVSVGQGSIAIVGGGDATLSDSQLSHLAQNVVTAYASTPSMVPALGQPMQVHFDDSLFPPPGARTGWRAGYSPSVVRPVTALGRLGRYVSDPSVDAAKYFAQQVRALGVGARIATRLQVSADAPLIAQHIGTSVSNQVKYMLQVSENNISENLFYQVGQAMGKGATWQGGQAATMQALRNLGVPISGLSLTSGSGVGRNDRIRASTLTKLLSRIADNVNFPALSAIYYGGGLPLAGRTGTLGPGAGRYTTPPTSCAAGQIRAKTGTLHDVVALSGLTVGTDGRLKAFSIIVNNRPERRYRPLVTRKAVDQLATTVYGCW